MDFSIRGMERDIEKLYIDIEKEIERLYIDIEEELEALHICIADEFNTTMNLEVIQYNL